MRGQLVMIKADMQGDERQRESALLLTPLSGFPFIVPWCTQLACRSHTRAVSALPVIVQPMGLCYIWSAQHNSICSPLT